MFKKSISLIFTGLIFISGLFSQKNQIGQELNAITTGVPFLLISPDARSGGMGDAGVATSPDANSIHWNTAKYIFADEDFAVNISYIPWLRKLVGDINFSNISAYKKIDDNQAFALSLMYFSLGNITFTDITGSKIKDYRPNEFSIDAGYSLKLTNNLSGGVALRYIHSNLTGGFAQNGSSPTHPGQAVAGDISAFYTKALSIDGRASNLSLGMNIPNLGSKISYSDDAYQEFLPANFRLGTALEVEIDNYNKITATVDFNKLLVPSPPITVTDADGNETILGKSQEVSVPKGVFQSFSDAPYGFKEELHEIMYSAGIEYMYANQFALRGGYFNEHSTKGNRKYFTFGVGLKLNVFALDFAYLVPTAGRQNPLAGTLRFTLGFNFKGLKEQNEKVKPKVPGM